MKTLAVNKLDLTWKQSFLIIMTMLITLHRGNITNNDVLSPDIRYVFYKNNPL